MRTSLVLLCLLLTATLTKAQHAAFPRNPYIEATPDELMLLGTGDINGDGLTDIVCIGRPHIRKFYVWLQGSNGQLQSPVIIPYPTSISATCLMISDLDGNGTSEILVGMLNKVNIYKWNNNTLIIEDELATVHAGITGIATADLDGDNLTDIGVSGDNKYVTVIYRSAEAQQKWDIRQYAVAESRFEHVSAGQFGTLTKNALIYTDGAPNLPASVMTFKSDRKLENRQDLNPQNGQPLVNSATIVKKGSGKLNELWLVTGGNKPHSKVAVWRTLQNLPDTIFNVVDIPTSIQSANLDCDEDEEPVFVHPGWSSITVMTDTQRVQIGPWYQNQDPDCLALGDVNNDGKIDICTIDPHIGLIILTNITSPCWPTELSKFEPATENLSIYPNPANDDVTITADITGTLIITDLYGKSIYHSEFARKALIDMQQWPSGVYMVTLQNNHYSYTQKLMKY